VPKSTGCQPFAVCGTKVYKSPAAAAQFKKFLQAFPNGSDLYPGFLLLVKGL